MPSTVQLVFVVGRQVIDAIRVDIGRRGGERVAALVGHQHAVSGVDEWLDLVPPRVRTLGKSVDEDNDRIAGFTGVDHVQFDPVGCHTPLLPCHGEHGRRRLLSRSDRSDERVVRQLVRSLIAWAETG